MPQSRSSKDRRRACRYPATGVQAYLAWPDPARQVTPAPSSTSGSRHPHLQMRRTGSFDSLKKPGSEMVHPDKGWRRTSVLVLDISTSGASMLVDDLPPPHMEVLLYLDAPCRESVEGTVVGQIATSEGPHLVRVQFQGPCSYELFRRLAFGK